MVRAEGGVDVDHGGVHPAIERADMCLEELCATLDTLQTVLCHGEVGGEAGIDHPTKGLGLFLLLDAEGLAVLTPRGQNLASHGTEGWGTFMLRVFQVQFF